MKRGMGRLLTMLGAAGWACAATAQNCPVVDFGDNLFWYGVGIPAYRAGTPGARNPERIKLAEGEFINGHSFSMTNPLSMVTADYNTRGNNTRFYGGMKTHTWDNPSNKYAWSEGGCNIDHEGYDDLNYMGFALESLHEPGKPGCRQTAIGVWLWKKEDFLNGGDRHPVTFDENSRIAVFLSRTYPVNQEHAKRLIAEGRIPPGSQPFKDTYANQQESVVPRDRWRGWETVHFVVQDGDQFYVAESAFEPVQQTLLEIRPARERWAAYNPQGPWAFDFNHKEALFEPRTFRDVRAAGWMICKNTAENSTLWCKWYGFGMDAVVTRPPEEMSVWNLPMRKVGELWVAADEVSYEQWRRVWKWGQRNAFCLHRSFAFDRDGNMGSMAADDQPHDQREPVTGITWHDAVVWCNALSLYEGRTPCYYADPEFKQVLRVARDGTDLARSLVPPVVYVNESAGGYRLPTREEWKQAAAKADAAGLSGFSGGVWEYIWDRNAQACDMAADPMRTVVGGSGDTKVSPLPFGDRPSRGHHTIGFRPVRGPRVASPAEAINPALVWSFRTEAIRPPATPGRAADLAPTIDMLAMNGFEGGRTEVTYAQWRAVFQWAEVNGYHFSWDGDMGSMAWDAAPTAHTPDEPVTGVGVLDAAIWCNALSEMTGRKPCYYRDAALAEPLRIADPFRVISYQWTDGNVRDGGPHKVLPKFLFHLDEQADGYRLPMSDEWTAMCGGPYPSGASFEPETAWYAGSSGERTHPVGRRKPTGPGFMDLSGNVFEWAVARAKTPRPEAGLFFDLEARGGSFRSDDKHPKSLGVNPMRGAWNWISNGVATPELGFRVVRRPATGPGAPPEP